jgi:hypothetical protein
MAMKRTIHTSKAVPKRSALHNDAIDYNPKSKLLESELEKILAGSSGGKIPLSTATPSDVSKILKTFSMPKSKYSAS